MPTALKDGKLQEVKDHEVDIDLTSPNQYFSTHINLVPTPSAVQAPRAFYAEKFIAQALPLRKPEAPLVQNLVDGDEKGRSFDELFGENAGALRANEPGEVISVSPDEIVYKNEKGEKKTHELFNAFGLNRKTGILSAAHVKKGDKFKPGDLLAHSNFTDENGTLALGLNARVGLVPFKGHSMDDAVVISQSLANRLTSDHYYQRQQDWDHDVKGGLHHYVSLFPTRFTKDQLSNMDEHGVIKPGSVLKEGDPMILATRPKMVSSSSGVSGLSRAMRQARADGAQVWDDPNKGVVTDVVHNKGNVKVVVHTQHPVQVGDKLTQRSGNKGTVSLIIPDEHMPRTMDGKPLELLLNQLGIPSRVNDALPYELMLGKVAAKTGRPVKLPSFTKPGEDWHTLVSKALAENGLTDKEEVFDPQSNMKLENPITVGNCFIMKLHHESASKTSARGQGGYTSEGQPLKGGGDSAQSKRLSGLEVASMLSSGAYANIREGATIRGQKNDNYWRAIRAGHRPADPGAPDVWKKFHVLLAGAGIHSRHLGNERYRLGPFTDKDLEERKPTEIKKGDMVNINTLEPIEGGLFSPGLVGTNGWGKIPLPFPVVNPAFETSVRSLLGLTQNEFREIMAGRMELPTVHR